MMLFLIIWIYIKTVKKSIDYLSYLLTFMSSNNFALLLHSMVNYNRSNTLICLKYHL